MDLADITRPPHWAERFWWYVDKGADPTSCWLWTASRDAKGYGQYNVVCRGGWRSMKAHRLAWLLAHGALDDDLLVCHSCDIAYARGDIAYRACVRAEHLFLGTDADNVRHMMAAGRGPVAAAHGATTRGVGNAAHKLSEAQVLEMRARFAAGEQLCMLSRAYGVNVNTAVAVVYGRSWSHLPGAVARPAQRVIARGIRAGNARLTETDVSAIRERFARGESKSSLGRAFQLSPSHVRDIVHGVLWTQLPGVTPRAPLALAARRSSLQAGAKLSAEAVRDIRRRAAAGERQSMLAREYGVSAATINALLRGRTYVQVLLDNDE